MTTPDKKAGADNTPASCDPSCACPPSNDNQESAPKPRGFLRGMFKKCAACAGSGTAGFLVGHAGCVITPLVIAAAGVTTATAGVSALALAFSAAATAGGLYAWHKLRGKTATKFEKRLVIGSAITGLLASTIMMNIGHHGGHPQNQNPTPHHQHHDHSHHGTHDAANANDKLSPDAAAFFGRLDAKQQQDMRDNAAMLKMSLPEYLNGICVTPANSTAGKPAAAPVRTARAPGM